MEKDIALTNNHSLRIEYPDLCPLCHHYGDVETVRADWIRGKGEPGVKRASLKTTPTDAANGDITVPVRSGEGIEDLENLEVVYRCPYSACRRFFIGSYVMPDPTLVRVRPYEPSIQGFPSFIFQFSPDFVLIHGQAEKARYLGLDQIAGPGYRKALEFLVKDYAKRVAPDKAQAINASPSGAVIKEYLPEPRLQAVARRAVWLGNDETHYLKKWTDHDINDLVTLIRLTVDWMEIEVLSKEYVQGMPD